VEEDKKATADDLTSVRRFKVVDLLLDDDDAAAV